MNSILTEDGKEVNLDAALHVATAAARKAGRVIEECILRRRSLVSSFFAPISLTKESNTTCTNDNNQRNDTMKYCGSDEHVKSKELASSSYTLHVNNVQQDSTENVVQKENKTAELLTSGLKIETKSNACDLVTQYDKLCDSTIIAMLKEFNEKVRQLNSDIHFTFITEELNPDVPLGDEYTWIVDPIDGTMSFVHGLPDCCVSIALTHHKQPVVAVVFAPFISKGNPLNFHFSNKHNGCNSAKLYDTVENDGKMEKMIRAEGAAPQPSPPTNHRNIESNCYTVTPDGSNLVKANQEKREQVSNIMKKEEKEQQEELHQHETITSTSPRARVLLQAQPCSSSLLRQSASSDIHDSTGDLYTAIVNRGSFLNGVPLHVRPNTPTDQIVAIFNYPFNVKMTDDEMKQVNSADLRVCKHHAAIDAAARIRAAMYRASFAQICQYGSGVLGFITIATGSADVYVEPSGKAWDVAAASLIVHEAGGYVCNLLGKPLDMSHDTTMIVSCNKAIAQLVVEMCRKEKYSQYWLLD